MEIIKKYFELSALQEEQFRLLGELYKSWNEKINVISRKDIDNLYERHVLHSLAIAKVIRFNHGTRILDAGTGGGFPGIPLAIMFPDAEFLLADSIGKKIAVVNAVCNEAGIKNVKSFHGRFEKLNETFDFIVSRAVTALPEFCQLTRHLLRGENRNALANGILYLKGNDRMDELEILKKQYKVFDLDKLFTEEYFLTKKLIHIF